MKRLAFAAVALALIGAAPQQAAAQEAGAIAGAVAATVVGAAVGGAIGYYYFTGIAATTIGIIGGGAIGDWWYTAATSGGGGIPSGKMKMRYTDAPPLFQLIDSSGRSQAGLRPAAFSAASD